MLWLCIITVCTTGCVDQAMVVGSGVNGYLKYKSLQIEQAMLDKPAVIITGLECTFVNPEGYSIASDALPHLTKPQKVALVKLNRNIKRECNRDNP